MRGEQRSGKSFFKDDLFFVEEDQYYMYKRDGKWNAYGRFCFLKPSPVEESYIFKPLSEEPLMGVMQYPNEYLKSQGIKKGDKVSFQPNTEYEFSVDNEKMYRIYDHQIVMSL